MISFKPPRLQQFETNTFVSFISYCDLITHKTHKSDHFCFSICYFYVLFNGYVNTLNIAKSL